MVPLVYQKKREKGQGVVEYAFLFVLLALVIAVSTEYLGPIIKNTFTRIVNPFYQDSGGQTPIPTITPVPTQTPTQTPTPIPTWTTCAVENAFCSFSGTALVRYGANGTWTSGTFTDGVLCSNSVFGDPLYGTVKSCQIYR